MKLAQRLGLAWKVVRNQARTAPRGTALLGGVYPGRAGAPPKRDVRLAAATYLTHPWVRATVGKVANVYAAVEWRLAAPRRGGKFYRDPRYTRAMPAPARAKLVESALAAGDLVEINDHPALDLLRQPTPTGMAGQLPGITSRKLRYIYRTICGESFEIVDRASTRGALGRGVPSALWTIPPHWVQRTPTLDSPTFHVSYGGYQADIPAEDMYWSVQHPDTLNPYDRGSGTGRAMGDELDADEMAAQLQTFAFYNRGRPDVIVSLEGADGDEVDAAREEWNAKTRGVANYLRAFFTNTKANVTTLSQSFKELELLDLRKFGRDAFRMILGLPPEILGDIENSNRSTIDAADYLLMKNVVVPELQFECEYRQATLIPEYDDRLVLYFVNPVQEDAELQKTIITTVPAAFQVDEIRARAGEGPLPDGAGESHLVTFSQKTVATLRPPDEQPQQGLNGAQIAAAAEIVRQVAAGEIPRDSGIGMLETLFNLSTEQAESIMGSAGKGLPTNPNPNPQAVPPPDMTPGGGGEGGEGDVEADDEGEDDPPPPPAKIIHRRKSLRTLEHWSGLVGKLLAPGEADYRKAYRSFSRDLEADQVARVLRASQGTPAGVLLFPAVLWREAAKEAMAPTYGRIFDAAAEEMGEELGQKALRKASRRNVLQHLARVVGSTVDTTRERLKVVLESAVLDGLTMEETAGRVRAAFDGWEDDGRYDAIARDQTSATVSGAREVVMEDAGVERAEWLTAGDELVRESHIVFGTAEPQPLDFNYADLVGGGFVLRRPHDPDCEDLSQVINCRCVKVPV